MLLLESAGFTEIEVRGDHSDAEPTADDDFLVFLGRRPVQPGRSPTQ